MEEVGCIFCPGAGSVPALEENGFVGRRCLNCGLIFISPRPSPDEVLALYQDDHAYVSADSLVSSASMWSARDKGKRIIRYIQRYVPRGRLLDLGAGGGSVLVAARAAGFDVVAVEPNPKQAAHIRTRLNVPCFASLSELADDNETFDAVFHGDVLSHFSYPIEEFRRFNAILRDNGVMVFETGNIAEVDPRYMSAYPRLQYPDHLYFFGEHTLSLLLQRTGFSHLDTRRYSVLPTLRLASVLTKIRDTAAPSGGSPSDRPASGDSSAAGGEVKRRVARHLSAAAWNGLYALTYGAGAIAPKQGRPQTLLVAARKLTPAVAMD